METHRLARGFLAVLVACSGLAVAPRAACALAQRTFVASNGNDANACSLAAPCRGFARAITQTADKGEIIVLDSAGYGAVTIDKSVSIIAPSGIYAGISVFTGSGVTVATSGVKVLLRGLTINGQGGSIGIDFSAGGGAELVVEQCTIANMLVGGVSAANLSSRIIVRDSVVRRNGGHGIAVAEATVATIDRTRVERNTGAGIKFIDGAWGTVSEATISGNGQPGVFGDSAKYEMQISVDRSVIVENGAQGAYLRKAFNTGGEIRMAVTRSIIARNSGDGVGFSQESASSPVHGEVSNNEITGNGSAGISVFRDPFLNTVSVYVAGNHIVRNGQGFFTNVPLHSLGNNLIEDNVFPDSGTMTIVSSK